MSFKNSMPIIAKVLIISFFFVHSGCGLYKPVDARKVSPSGIERSKKNIEDGKGFKLFDSNRVRMGGAFQFANSNGLWRASLDVIDFMPLSSVNYLSLIHI